MIAGFFSGVIDLGPKNDARLHRLRTALVLGARFQLVIVEVEPGPIRDEVIRRIAGWSGIPSIGELAHVALDANATLQAQLDVKSGAIVTGLEPSSPTDPAVRDWIAELNWARDALPELILGPLVLVVSQAAHRELFERGTDLYTWRRHTARVAITIRELALPLSSQVDHYYLRECERLPGVIAAAASVFSRAVAICDLGSVFLELGDEPNASHLFNEAASLAASLSHEQVRSFVRTYCMLSLAEAAVVRRDLQTGRSLLDKIHRVVHAEMREAEYAVVRGKLLAAEGTWDAAEVEFDRAIGIARRPPTPPQTHASALEGLLQVAFARGDIAIGRQRSAELIRIAALSSDTWGGGMLLRVAEAVLGFYPDECAPLLDAASAASEDSSSEDSSSRERALFIELVRVERGRLLHRLEGVGEALARAECSIRPDDPAELRAFLHQCKATIAMTNGGGSDDDIDAWLASARALYRPARPRRSVAVGMLLAEFWRNKERFDRAAAAYHQAAEDARSAKDGGLVASAELGHLHAAIDGSFEAEDACDRLGALIDGFHVAEQRQSEGIARVALGRCLLRRGHREDAVNEFGRARACFDATADTARELWVAQQLAAVDGTH